MSFPSESESMGEKFSLFSCISSAEADWIWLLHTFSFHVSDPLLFTAELVTLVAAPYRLREWLTIFDCICCQNQVSHAKSCCLVFAVTPCRALRDVVGAIASPPSFCHRDTMTMTTTYALTRFHRDCIRRFRCRCRTCELMIFHQIFHLLCALLSHATVVTKAVWIRIEALACRALEIWLMRCYRMRDELFSFQTATLECLMTAMSAVC